MRNRAYLLFLFAPSALLAYACGGDSGQNDGGTDATTDQANGDATQPDSSGMDGASDSSNNDSGGNDAGMGMDVQISITCAFPAECVDGGDWDAAYPPADAGEVCCGTLTTSGTFPGCSLSSITTSCAAPGSCPTTIDTSSCGTDTVRGCKHKGECTESGYNQCCTVKQGDAGITFCMSTGLATLLGASCTNM
jgi:hypothetical protein